MKHIELHEFCDRCHVARAVWAATFMAGDLFFCDYHKRLYVEHANLQSKSIRLMRV